MDQNKQAVEFDPNELTLKDVISKVRSFARFVLSKWYILLIFTIIGGGLGFTYYLLKKPIYTASSTFVLEDGNKSSLLGQYSGLATLAGIDLGGSGGGGIFQGDNILELYKSRLMVEKTLLSEVVIQNKKQLLIDRFIDINHLRNKWAEKDKITKIDFSGNPEMFDRQQDSIITDIVKLFNKNFLSVTKPDKKLSVIKVEFSNRDELFAQAFNSKLVETVNNFYTETKTKKSAQNLHVLQRQADSTRALLNNSISGVASAIDASPNANPALSTLRVPSQKRQIDVQASSAVYSELIKNLELGKIALRQETPLIQVIDQPVLPLDIKKASIVVCLLAGIAGGLFVSLIYMIMAKVTINLRAARR